MKNNCAVILALTGLCASVHAAITIGPSNRPFTSIAASGTSVGAITDDSELIVTGAALTAMGWAGNDLLPANRSIRVGNNGAILLGNSATDAFGNATEIGYANCNANNVGATSIATMTAINDTVEGNGGLAPRQMVCVLWDDNFPSTSVVTSCRYQVMSGNLIVQWTNEDHFAAQGSGVITYEVVFYGGATIASGAPIIEFVYDDTLYGAQQYQNDGGSAAIGFKNWNINTSANDLEFGTSGGSGALTTDPAFNDASMHPKVAGWTSSANSSLPHSVVIAGVPPCGSADFNHDGDAATDADIEAFFACIAGNCCAACDSNDFNGDGDASTDADIEAFFRVLAGGNC
jgi:hypothetical protein